MGEENTTICREKQIRRWDIDWLRVISVLFVFVIHVSRPFNPLTTFPMKSDSQSYVFVGFIFWQDFWIMPIFMFLAGSSIWFSLKRRTNKQFIDERVNRILLPLAICIPLLVSPQVYLERLFQGQFDGSFFQFFPHFFNGIYPEGNLSWHHLWFLFYLFCYTLITLPLFRFLMSGAGDRFLKRLAGWCETPGAIFLFAIPLIIGQLILGRTFPKAHTFLNDWAWHWQLLSSFIFGFIIISDNRFEKAIEKTWKIALFLSITCTMVTYFYNDFHVQFIKNVYPRWTDFFFGTVLHGLGSWSWIMVLFGIGKMFLNFRNKILDYTSEAVYPFYMLHPPIVIIMIYFVLPMDIGLWSKWLLILFFSFLLSMVAYEIFKRWRVTRYIIGLK